MNITREQIAMRKKWVRALRSGEYEQARRMLRDGNAFCCIGVACDVADKKGWGVTTGMRYAPHHGNSYSMNDDVRERFGLTKVDQNDLMEMNDGKSCDDFATIADAIELITLADMED